MIEKKDFLQLMTNHIEWDKKVDEASSLLSLPLFESDLIDYTNGLFLKTIKSLFNEEGVEDITWWIYERDPDMEEPQMWRWDGENEVKYPTNTLEDLWNIVKDNRI